MKVDTDTFPRRVDVHSRAHSPSVCSTSSTRTRWISPRSETSRDFMLHSNCRWSTELLGRCAELNLPLSNFPCDFFPPFDRRLDPRRLLCCCCFFFDTGSAFAVLIEFKPGSGHAARQWREHRFRGHSQRSGLSECCIVAGLIALSDDFFNAVCSLPSYRSSPEWNDGGAACYGGVQTGTVVKDVAGHTAHTWIIMTYLYTLD